jgi:hypothetical protein
MSQKDPERGTPEKFIGAIEAAIRTHGQRA